MYLFAFKLLDAPPAITPATRATTLAGVPVRDGLSSTKTRGSASRQLPVRTRRWILAAVLTAHPVCSPSSRLASRDRTMIPYPTPWLAALGPSITETSSSEQRETLGPDFAMSQTLRVGYIPKRPVEKECRESPPAADQCAKAFGVRFFRLRTRSRYARVALRLRVPLAGSHTALYHGATFLGYFCQNSVL
jgi:hypothetical protein